MSYDEGTLVGRCDLTNEAGASYDKRTTARLGGQGCINEFILEFQSSFIPSRRHRISEKHRPPPAKSFSKQIPSANFINRMSSSQFSFCTMTDCTDRQSMASRQAYTKARGKIYSGHNEKYLVIQ